jgi:hypothetical protein
LWSLIKTCEALIGYLVLPLRLSADTLPKQYAQVRRSKQEPIDTKRS